MVVQQEELRIKLANEYIDALIKIPPIERESYVMNSRGMNPSIKRDIMRWFRTGNTALIKVLPIWIARNASINELTGNINVARKVRTAPPPAVTQNGLMAAVWPQQVAIPTTPREARQNAFATPGGAVAQQGAKMQKQVAKVKERLGLSPPASASSIYFGAGLLLLTFMLSKR